jgi:antitoxin component YwqK of YwqJK toxin-antitoxin module
MFDTGLRYNEMAAGKGKFVGFAIACCCVLACKESRTIETRYETGERHEVYDVLVTDTGEVRHGKYERFDPSGALLERSTYNLGRIHGLRQLFENGVLKSEEARVYDRYHGPYIAYYTDGTHELEAAYAEDEMTGEVHVFYPSGKIKEKVTFEHNAEWGPFEEYYENGRTKAMGTYRQSEGPVEHGELKLFDSAGQLVRTLHCDMGRCTTIWKRDTASQLPF